MEPEFGVKIHTRRLDTQQDPSGELSANQHTHASYNYNLLDGYVELWPHSGVQNILLTANTLNTQQTH